MQYSRWNSSLRHVTRSYSRRTTLYLHSRFKGRKFSIINWTLLTKTKETIFPLWQILLSLSHYGYLLYVTLQCLFCEDTTEKRWRPHTFSCLVTETLMALFTSCNITPEEAERKMQEWGARPVRVGTHLGILVSVQPYRMFQIMNITRNVNQLYFSGKKGDRKRAVDTLKWCSTVLISHSKKGTPAKLLSKHLFHPFLSEGLESNEVSRSRYKDFFNFFLKRANKTRIKVSSRVWNTYPLHALPVLSEARSFIWY